MNDIDKMPSKCRDCPYWELAAEPYVCSDCTTPVKKCGGDYILRSDAISAIRAVSPGNWTWARYADNVACVPAADVEPVVRCKDCKHRDPENLRCDHGGLERAGCIFPVSDNYFCAHGERKENVDD